MSSLFGEFHTDILCFGAHPDDIEIGVGGTVAQEVLNGKRVVLCDLTEGELGSRGSVQQRYKESEDARTILGAAARINCQLPDGALNTSVEFQDAVVQVMRTYRPRTILYNGPVDRHPDHEQAHQLVRYAIFRSGLASIDILSTEGKRLQPWRPEQHFSYLLSYEHSPSFFVDISSTFQTKMDAIRAYKSQFHTTDAAYRDEPETFISRPGFLDMITSRARYFGERVGCSYAEAFMSVEPLSIQSLDSFS